MTSEFFASLNPITGDEVGRHPVHDAADVAEAVRRAREGSARWSARGFADREAALKRWNGVLARRLPQLAVVVHEETGKPYGEAELEIALAIEHLAWAAAHARRVLGRRLQAPGLLMINEVATLEYRPLGVVGVIGPWNYPVYTPMGSISGALAAGNAVVFKPSEFTPGVAMWLADSFAEAVGDAAVFQVVTGFAETGAALCRAGVDKIAFIGSGRTGRKVMGACAENLVPVLIEAGGKDALLVDDDADLALAAEAAVWGGMANAGQTCIGVERVYVHEKVYDAFLDRVSILTAGLRAGPDGAIGPSTVPTHVAVVRRHIEDALRRGGRLLVGGVPEVGAHYVQPTVLIEVPEDSVAVTEETFGPTLTVTKVRDMDEAIELTNASRYGLGAAVFSRHHGAALAARLRCGMTSVNAVISFAAVPTLPFGGVGESGFGRVHGAAGLREFSWAKSVTSKQFRPPLLLTSFARTPKTEARLGFLVRSLHGTSSTVPTHSRRWSRALRRRS